MKSTLATTIDVINILNSGAVRGNAELMEAIAQDVSYLAKILREKEVTKNIALIEREYVELDEEGKIVLSVQEGKKRSTLKEGANGEEMRGKISEFLGTEVEFEDGSFKVNYELLKGATASILTPQQYAILRKIY
jgi:hypothetical protein